MRAITPLIFALPIWIFTPAARAETQVKAEDCSAAVSGLTIGARVEIHCLSKEDIARVIDEFRTGLTPARRRRWHRSACYREPCRAAEAYSKT